MSENISHSPYESAPATKSIEHKGPDFSALQDRLALGEIPWGAEILDNILKFLPTLPSPVRSDIEKDLQWIGDGMINKDVLVRLQSNLDRATNQKKTEVKTQEKEHDQKITEHDHAISENKTDKSKERENIRLSRERVSALYDSFGGQNEFQRLNPELHTWQERAKKELIRDEPALAQDPELEQKALLRAIHENRANIDKNAQSLAPELRSKYASESQKLFRNIESSLVELQVPHEKMDIPPLSRDVGGNPKVLFPDLKDGEPLTRTGSEFRHGDQVIDTANPPPRKFIVAESNWKPYESDIPVYKPPYENLQAQADCLKSLREVSPNFDGSPESAKRFEEISIASLWKVSSELAEREAFLQDEISDGSQNHTGIEKLKSEVSSLKAQKKDISDKLENFRKLMEELKKLKQEESQRIPDYQKQVAEKDDIVRENIRFIDSSWLSALDKKSIDTIIAVINQRRQLHGEERIDLKKPLTEKDRSDILKGAQTLLKEHGEGLFRTDERGYVSLVEDGNIRDRVTAWLRQAGLIGTIGEDADMVIEERMKEGFEEKKDEEEGK